MKCGACGYMRIVETRRVDDVIYYKSGKRRGEVKDITGKYEEFTIGDEDFVEIKIVLGIQNTIDVYICPKCATFRTSEEELKYMKQWSK